MEYLWLVFALLSAVTGALVAVFAKVGLRDIDPNTATALRAIIMALFLVAVVIVEGKLSSFHGIVSDSRALTFIVLSGVAGALSWLFYFLAIKFGRVSQVVPIDRLSIVFAIVLAALFLGEKLTLKAAIGAALVAVGAVIIALG